MYKSLQNKVPSEIPGSVHGMHITFPFIDVKTAFVRLKIFYVQNALHSTE